MYNILNPPPKPPTEPELPEARTQLALLLDYMISELIKDGEALIKVGTAEELARVVHSAAGKLSGAGRVWGTLSQTIRENWRI
jgi:hypothetical protein